MREMTKIRELIGKYTRSRKLWHFERKQDFIATCVHICCWANRDFCLVLVGWLCWGLTSQSTIFQSCRDGAIASWVINQYFRGVKCLAQGHNTAEVGLEPRTSRSGVRHSTTEPPCSPSVWCKHLLNVSCLMTKPTKWHVPPAKTHISLDIRPVWSESSLSAWRKLGSLATHWVHSEDSDQTDRMPRLIWVFAGCTDILLVLSWGGSCEKFSMCYQRISNTVQSQQLFAQSLFSAFDSVCSKKTESGTYFHTKLDTLGHSIK